MGNLHWLIVIPFYFFTALSLFFALSIGCRIIRAKVGANPLAVAAAVTALLTAILPVAAGWVPLAAYTTLRMVGLGVASFVLAAVDTLLMPSLALPLDDELREV
jgi:hypothetical protein